MSKSDSFAYKHGHEVMDRFKYAKSFFSHYEQHLIIKVLDEEVTNLTSPGSGFRGTEMVDRLSLLDNSIGMLIDLIKIKTFEPENWTFDILKDGWYSTTYNELQGGAGIVAVRSRILGLAQRQMEGMDDAAADADFLADSMTYNSLICKEKISLINQLVTQGIDYLGAVSA